MERVRDLAANTTAASWDDWFSPLFSLARRMIPNGRAATLEKFVRSSGTAAALRGAPDAIRDKVEFLLLVGRRDVDRIRVEGARLLEATAGDADSGFNTYVLVATATACFARDPDPDPGCRPVLERLDKLDRQAPVLDVLRAHRAARP